MSDAKRLEEAAINAARTQAMLQKLNEHLATPEGKAELYAHIQKRIEEQSDKDGRCRDKKCNGLIVKQVRGLCSFGYTYDIPCCSKCGRQYIFAEGNIPAVGHKEFEELMNQPFTI